MGRMRTILAFAVVLVLFASSQAIADNGSYTHSGGLFTFGTSAGTNISVQGAAVPVLNGTLSFTCPITSYAAGIYGVNWQCAGGSISVSNPAKSLVLNGAFLSGAMSLTAS